MRLRLALVALLLLPAASAWALPPLTELKRETDVFVPVLQLDKVDGDGDAAELSLEAREEFFPEAGSGSSRQSIQGSDTVVTFRLNGVPYALNDVPLVAWFAPYVRDMADRGIVTGYKDATGRPTGFFSPEKNVTLEELAKMAVEAARIDRTACPAVPKNPQATQSWSAQYVSCAESNAFAVYADGTVDLHRAATRNEVVMTALQAFGRPIAELGQTEKLFTDVSPSTLFSGAIKTAVADGIVSGYVDAKGALTGTFGPDNPINRAEVSKVLSIAIQVYVK